VIDENTPITDIRYAISIAVHGRFFWQIQALCNAQLQQGLVAK
jgi:hypothetical protein